MTKKTETQIRYLHVPDYSRDEIVEYYVPDIPSDGKELEMEIKRVPSAKKRKINRRAALAKLAGRKK